MNTKSNVNWFEQYSKLFEHSQELWGNLQNTEYSSFFHPGFMVNSFVDATCNIVKSKEKFEETHDALVKQWTDIGEYFIKKIAGQNPTPLVESKDNDRRFKDPAWESNLFLNCMKQSYLSMGSWMRETYDSVDGLDSSTKRRSDFLVRQFIDAISPSNNPFINPSVMRETFETGGTNLVRGFEKLLQDIEDKRYQITTTDFDYYSVGKNLAITPGKVIYQNDIMQLIHYTPSCEKVHEIPLLIVPPWINKYYILDLRPENSFVKWALDQGFSVFLISWVCPNSSHAHKSFDSYMSEGVIESLEVINKVTKSKEVNAVGYCLGGILLSAFTAYSKHEKCSKKFPCKIKTITLLTTLVDFQDAGDLSIFIDMDHLDQIENYTSRKGFFDGRLLSATFSILRANDLIWSYFINNYMLGKDPAPHDMLYWNADYVHMTESMYSFLTRELYHKNLLSKPERLKLFGVPIDLGNIDIPIYMLSTQKDHIAPWRATFNGSKLFKNSDLTFVLGSSGHVAGVINPPSLNKNGYWTNKKDIEKSADDWFDNSEYHDGSWWTDWCKWAKKYSGKKIAAISPEQGPIKPIEDAPGSYVTEKVI